jgi:hypothetical protein
MIICLFSNKYPAGLAGKQKIAEDFKQAGVFEKR